MQERDSARQAIREFFVALQQKLECGEGYWTSLKPCLRVQAGLG